MAKFVNYKKRDITLPSGCKNLIDVLQPAGTPKPVGGVHTGTVPIDAPPAITRGESIEGKLSDVRKFVAMVYESLAGYFILMASSPDERLTVEAHRTDDGAIEAYVMVQIGTEHERVVRSFFAQHGLHIPEDSGVPPGFLPNLRVQLTFEVSPLPPDAMLLSKLVMDLFRDAFGFTDDSPLTFRYYEITDPVS